MSTKTTYIFFEAVLLRIQRRRRQMYRIEKRCFFHNNGRPQAVIHTRNFLYLRRVIVITYRTFSPDLTCAQFFFPSIQRGSEWNILCRHLRHPKTSVLCLCRLTAARMVLIVSTVLIAWPQRLGRLAPLVGCLFLSYQFIHV